MQKYSQDTADTAESATRKGKKDGEGTLVHSLKRKKLTRAFGWL
jgi:hypothetical protein